MPVQIRCQCGKRYRVADQARNKRLRCKECGAELVMPRESKPQLDDDVEFAELADDQGIDDDENDRPRLPRRAARFRPATDTADAEFDGVFSIGDVLVRGSGLLVFLATAGNCAYQSLRARPQGQDPTFDIVTWGVTPLVVGGLIGLYIAWVGEEPDFDTRRGNRFRGVIKFGIGIGVISLGRTFARRFRPVPPSGSQSKDLDFRMTDNSQVVERKSSPDHVLGAGASA